MSVFAWLSLISSLLSAGVAMAVLHANPRAKVNRFFTISNLGLAVNAFSEFMYRQATDPALVRFWTKVNIGCLGAVILFLCFVFVYTGQKRFLRHPVVALLVYLPAAAFTILGLATDLVAGEPLKTAWGYVTSAIPSRPLVFYLYNSWLVLLGAFIFILFARYFGTTHDPRRKAQSRIFIIGFLPILAAGLLELILGYYGTVIPSTVSTTLVWLNLCIGFAIWREELFAPNAAAAADNIIAGMTDPLILINRSGNVTRVNPAFRELFGYGEPEILGRSFRLLFAQDADASGIPDLLAAGMRLEHREAEFISRTGDKIYGLVSGGAVRSGLWKSWGFVLLIHDITRRQEGEKELQRLAVDLEYSNRELECFVSAASHDLKEPLRKIFIYGEKLLEAAPEALADREREEVRRIQEAAQRMRKLIEGLLDYSHIARGVAQTGSVDLNQVLSDALADLEIPLKQSGGTVRADALPVITAEPLLMHQLFQNLIGNALKYRRPGVPPLVRVTVETSDGTIRLRFEDNGIGFDNAHRDKMFRIFQRLVGRNEFEGAGIGLAICRKIAEHHGGRISAAGVPGAGSVFTVELPAPGGTGNSRRF
jgi:PAS domain S-box-containing protein